MCDFGGFGIAVLVVVVTGIAPPERRKHPETQIPCQNRAFVLLVSGFQDKIIVEIGHRLEYGPARVQNSCGRWDGVGNQLVKCLHHVIATFKNALLGQTVDETKFIL